MTIVPRSPSRRRRSGVRLRCGVARVAVPAVALMSLAAGCVLWLRGGGPAVVSVFPVPGSRVAPPGTQIVFRGVPVGRLGRIVVTGSRSGRHRGRLEGDSDGRGGSFLPAKPFLPGEVVTVRTRLRVRGAAGGRFRFTIATPAGPVPIAGLAPAPRVAGDVDAFRSRPDLTPPAVEIITPASRPGEGDIFLTPQQGPLENGPMILAPDGSLVWFEPVPSGEMAADLRVQRYRGRPVLTWWQGRSGAGIGMGEDVIDSSSYRRLAVVRAGNGLQADLHEFQLTPQGDALITAYFPVIWSLRAVGGPARGIVLDSVVQEIDIRTGLVLFQWDSLDHVPLRDSYEPLPASAGQPYDYFHVNSIQQERDGDLVISARNTWAAYEVSPVTGRVLWVLGGKHSSFKVGRGASFAFQHDVRVYQSARRVTVFDDGAGPPVVHRQSRGLTLRLNTTRRTATLVRADRHTAPLLADFEGDVQSLGDGDQFVGWGQQPYFTEFDSHGQIIFDGRFVDQNSSYRAYRFPWTATPPTRPAIAALTGGHGTTVFASWNGATAVAWWRVLAGARPAALHVAATAPRSGFETEITVPAAPYVAVEALNARGRVLARSATVRPS